MKSLAKVKIFICAAFVSVNKCERQEIASYFRRETAYLTIDHEGNWTVQPCRAVHPALNCQFTRKQLRNAVLPSTTYSFPE